MDKIEETFEHWISQYPESHHPLDEERYYEFIDEVVAYDDYIGPSWLRDKLGTTKHSMSNEQVEQLITEFDTLVEYGKRLMRGRS
jgi:hypothetical protein